MKVGDLLDETGRVISYLQNCECSILTESEKLGFRLNGKRCRNEQSEHAKFHDYCTKG